MSKANEKDENKIVKSVLLIQENARNTLTNTLPGKSKEGPKTKGVSWLFLEFIRREEENNSLDWHIIENYPYHTRVDKQIWGSIIYVASSLKTDKRIFFMKKDIVRWSYGVKSALNIYFADNCVNCLLVQEIQMSRTRWLYQVIFFTVFTSFNNENSP